MISHHGITLININILINIAIQKLIHIVIKINQRQISNHHKHYNL
jgi:hypothetical protein